jgi:hypothetical protein
MKKYFFGYLFVRIAKLLAVIIVQIGLAYAIFSSHKQVSLQSRFGTA